LRPHHARVATNVASHRVFGEAAIAAPKNQHLPRRALPPPRPPPRQKALVAVARSILVIVWHLLADPSTRYRDLGADFYTNHIDRQQYPPTRPPLVFRRETAVPWSDGEGE
jgi:hypothetical protein